MFDIPSAAYVASQALAQQGLHIKRSHLAEVLAALLGYRSLAALQIEEADAALDYHLDDAERLVLHVPMGQERATQLVLPQPVTAECVEALKTTAMVPVHVSVSDLFDGFAREALEQAIYDGDATAGAMAESNASFPDYPDLEGEGEPSGDLWASPKEWSIEASGTLGGEYDPEGDRMYNGHQLDVWGKLVFAKAGRAGLIYLDSDEGASADDSWRDEEF